MGKSLGGDNFSVAWCQPEGLIQVVGRERDCVSQCCFEERHYMREEILTGVVATHTRTTI